MCLPPDTVLTDAIFFFFGGGEGMGNRVGTKEKGKDEVAKYEKTSQK
jgi:hypothetical protein